MLEEIVDKPAVVEYHGPEAGDVKHTWADTGSAQRKLGFRAEVGLQEGLQAEAAWLVGAVDVSGARDAK